VSAPLFIPDLDALKARLRLLNVTDEGAAVVDQALSEVRVFLFDALGPDLITTILLTEWDPSTSTTNGLRRLRASHLEVAWVRFLLMTRQPSMFVEFNASTLRQTWNEQGIVREASQSTLRRMLDEQWQAIQKMVSQLLDDDSDTSGIVSASLGAIAPVFRPWDSVRNPSTGGVE